MAVGVWVFVLDCVTVLVLVAEGVTSGDAEHVLETVAVCVGDAATVVEGVGV